MGKIQTSALLLAILSTGHVAAGEEVAISSETKKTQTVTEAGNKRCPVTGKPVDGVHFYTHDGKKYSLCNNGGCEAPFKKDPNRYALRAEKQGGGN